MDARGPARLAIALSALSLAACGERSRPAAPAEPTGVVARRAWEAFYRPPTDRVPHELATNPGTPWGDYAGSRACAPCHEKEWRGWRDSFHSRTLYDAVPETIFGDFSGDSRFSDPAFAYEVTPYRDGTKAGMRIRRNPKGAASADTYGAGLPPVPAGTFEVIYAFGNRRHQPYVTRAADGRHWVLPVYWNDVRREWMWDGWRPYVTMCAHCHVTGIRSTDRPGRMEDRLGATQPPRWNVAPKDEGWADGAVGCEACHGPGRPHIEAVRRMGEEPYRAYLRGGGEPTIYDPAKDVRERRIQQCDSCHNFFTESTTTWVPGPKGYPKDPFHLPLKPPDAQFWADGTHMSPCTVGTVLRESRMGRAGVECRDCHDPHGNAHWAELTASTDDNALCLRCHGADRGGRFADEDAVARHARHEKGSPGALCVECHMPRDKRFSNGVQVMSALVHSHAFSIPTGREDARGGPPPACNFCHVDRDSKWTREVLHAWKEGLPPPK